MFPRVTALTVGVLIIFSLQSQAQKVSKELQTLSEGFWAWRVATQPASYDDIPRVERPDGWGVDYSRLALIKRGITVDGFLNRLDALDKTKFSRADSIAYLLIRSAVSRADFELRIFRAPLRNPDFYVQQTLGIVYELLLKQGPFDEKRASNIVWRLESIPRTLRDAETNLVEPVAPFADIAIENLNDIRGRLEAVREGLRPLFPEKWRVPLDSAIVTAIGALEAYSNWLVEKKPSMSSKFSIGRDEYNRLLHRVALIPYTTEDLLRVAELEWNRTLAFEQFELDRNKGRPEPPRYESSAEQSKALRAAEENVRSYLVQKGILSVPSWIGHYGSQKIPSYVVPLRNLGVTNDLTSESRKGENAVTYIGEPQTATSFFGISAAEDVRPLLVHEGVPGHFFQLSLSWANKDPIRRRYYDSAPNEGLAFYAEEMMHQFGFFDDSPKTRETIYRFMRLRALRVAADVKLATGEFTIEQAANYLARTVPMDLQTAREEAAFFASTPGQAISYQIGKIQILKFLSDARLKLGEKFNLRAFHDYLWENGNVPIALLRWEYLGINDEVKILWDAK